MPEEERPTNTGSGSNEEDDENAGWVDMGRSSHDVVLSWWQMFKCHVLPVGEKSERERRKHCRQLHHAVKWFEKLSDSRKDFKVEK